MLNKLPNITISSVNMDIWQDKKPNIPGTYSKGKTRPYVAED
jgi:hypothetical protein